MNIFTLIYSLTDVALTTIDEFCELGVTFRNDLSFGKHIHMTAASAFRKLGFIKRFGKHFKNTDTLKLLYGALIRTQVEYASMVWDPYQLNHCILLERIQHRFLRYMSFKLGKPMKFTDHNYDYLLADLNLMTLANKKIYLSLSFLHKILNGAIDCPELLERIRLHVPARPLRFKPLFHLEASYLLWRL